MDCPNLNGCIFFNDKMAELPVMADVMKRKYCKKDNRQCARALVLQGLGRDAIPADMLPSQLERALELINQGK